MLLPENLLAVIEVIGALGRAFAYRVVEYPATQGIIAVQSAKTADTTFHQMVGIVVYGVVTHTTTISQIPDKCKRFGSA